MREILEKWSPLILLGLLGMFFSEFLIWNVAGFMPKLSQGVLSVLFAILVSALMYVFLFVIAVDIIQRFKINDFIGIVLLGSIYGLLLEGIFADKVFAVGLGPNLFEIWFSSLSFTALSWHPLIDFLGSFMVLKLLFKGKFNLAESKVGFNEGIVIFLFSFFWLILLYSPWLSAKIPQGLPIFIQFAILVGSAICLGLFVAIVLRYSRDYKPKKILGVKGYFLFLLFTIFFAILRFNSFLDKVSFWFFCCILLFYIALFILYIKSRDKNKIKFSVYEESFPIKEDFHLIKYLKIVGLFFISYFLAQVFTVLFSLGYIYSFLCSGLFVLSVFFALVFPIVVVIKIIYNFKIFSR